MHHFFCLRLHQRAQKAPSIRPSCPSPTLPLHQASRLARSAVCSSRAWKLKRLKLQPVDSCKFTALVSPGACTLLVPLNGSQPHSTQGLKGELTGLLAAIELALAANFPAIEVFRSVKFAGHREPGKNAKMELNHCVPFFLVARVPSSKRETPEQLARGHKNVLDVQIKII